jgi:hypothetical protein
MALMKRYLQDMALLRTGSSRYGLNEEVSSRYGLIEDGVFKIRPY